MEYLEKNKIITIALVNKKKKKIYLIEILRNLLKKS